MLQDAPMYAYIPAKDLARARKFYEEKVGLKASQAFWSVEDVDAEIVALKARGVVFEHYDMPGERSPQGAITAGGAKAAWFKDSEGNIMALIQTL